MPYIDQYHRVRLNEEIELLAKKINTKGELNYAITRILCLLTPQDAGYAVLSAMRAVLLDVYDEFSRKVLHRYEDDKEAVNGPVHGLGGHCDFRHSDRTDNGWFCGDGMEKP